MIQINMELPENCGKCILSRYGKELCPFENCNDTMADIEQLSNEEFEYIINHRHRNCPLSEKGEVR